LDTTQHAYTNISYAYCPYILWQDQPDSILALDRMEYASSASYTKSAKWLASTSASGASAATGSGPAPHKDAGGNILFNDGHASWANSLPNIAGTNGTPAIISGDI
jgi:prepilin-type processing-associated H-X9-DG protein